MIYRFLVSFFLSAVFCSTLFAQSKITQANCGDKITGEFTARNESLIFEIPLQPGQIMEAKVIPVGDYLKFRAELYDPLDTEIIDDPSGTFATPNQKYRNMKTGVISARGNHKLVLRNFRDFHDEGTAGVFTIHFTCINP